MLMPWPSRRRPCRRRRPPRPLPASRGVRGRPALKARTKPWRARTGKRTAAPRVARRRNQWKGKPQGDGKPPPPTEPRALCRHRARLDALRRIETNPPSRRSADSAATTRNPHAEYPQGKPGGRRRSTVFGRERTDASAGLRPAGGAAEAGWAKAPRTEDEKERNRSGRAFRVGRKAKQRKQFRPRAENRRRRISPGRGSSWA